MLYVAAETGELCTDDEFNGAHRLGLSSEEATSGKPLADLAFHADWYSNEHVPIRMSQ